MQAEEGDEPGRPRRPGLRRWAMLAGVLAIVALGGYLIVGDGAEMPGNPGGEAVLDDSARAPAGVRIRVEVLNATDTRGLARRATMELRDRGFDVVEVGNSSPRRDSTLVISRAGERDWAERVARAMGTALVESLPDSTRYVEVSVLLGADWSPPPGPFRP